MSLAFRKLAGWIHSHAHATLGVWAALIVIAAFGARQGIRELHAGSGTLPGSPSAEVSARLERDFSQPFTHTLAVVFVSEHATYGTPAFQAALSAFANTLRSIPEVRRVIVPEASMASRFRSGDGKTIVAIVALAARDETAAEQVVPTVREAVRRAAASEGFAAWRWHVTGTAAVLHDLGKFNALDSTRAELLALPFTLAVLLLVFGSLVSAALPLSLGVIATVLAVAAVPALGTFGHLNILYQNVASLLGLALGIDYSLFLLSRFREERERGRDVRGALTETWGTTGVAVVYSGLTVLIGLVGLALTPVFELRSMGLGGIAVVFASLVVCLTILPALVTVLDPWLDSPRKLAGWLRSKGSRARWEHWSGLVLRRPAPWLLVGLAILLVLSLPLLTFRPGFPDQPWLPAVMESSRGLEALRKLNAEQELTPVQILVNASDGERVIPQHLHALKQLSATLHDNTRVARVFGPVDLGPLAQGWPVDVLYADLDATLAQQPTLGELMFSHDRRQVLVQVVLRDGLGYGLMLDTVNEIQRIKIDGLELTVGGYWASCRDYDALLLAAYPSVFGSVIVATFLTLVFAFRSVLVPVKAIILNALSVTAAFGAVVAVFQWGWGVQLLGLDGPTGAIPLAVPLLIFAITFGLSMDYEVLLLSRVREAYLQTHDHPRSVHMGLVATGGLITGAAAIMTIVFGAFCLADMLLVKMLGFGLAVAVVVDAAIVRAMMVPAAMKLAGKWNWVPGIPARSP